MTEMTTKEKYSSKTQFSSWLRRQKDLDSQDGFIATDLDYIWMNYKNDKWMFIEEKRGVSSTATRAQRQIFLKLHQLAKADKNYQGFHELCFENTCPEDGKIYLNSVEIDKEQLIEFLQFKLKWKTLKK